MSIHLIGSANVGNFTNSKKLNHIRRQHKMGAITFHIQCRVIGSVIALLLHGGNSLAMFFAMRGDILKDPDIANLQATQFKYLTIWNVAFQMAYSVMSLVCDIPLLLSIKEESSSILCYLKYLRKYREVFFGGVVVPTGLAISTVFWPVFLYNRELIFPKFIDKALSPVSNQIMHSAIFFIAMWELLFHPRSKPRSHILYLGHMATIFFTYITVLFFNYAERGTWPYPLFTLVYGTIYFPLLLTALCIIYVLLYFAQWPLTSLVYSTNTWKKTEKIK